MKRVFKEQTYTSIEAYNRDWLDAFKKAGHEPVTDEDGHVDPFAYNPHDPHNGPRCKLCGEGWCWHCTPPWKIVAERCGGVAHAETVKREEEDKILAEAEAIRARRKL